MEGHVTVQVALGKSEAEAMSMATMEIVARAYPMMIAPTATLASFPPPLPIHQSAGGGRGPSTMLA